MKYGERIMKRVLIILKCILKERIYLIAVDNVIEGWIS